MQQKEHTISNCKACHNEHSALQIKFPQGPYYIPQPLVTIDMQELEQLGEKEGTRKAFREVNDTFSQVFNKSFTTTLLKHGKQPIQIKPSANERKKLRAVYRKCCDKENEVRQKTATIAVLTEDQFM